MMDVQNVKGIVRLGMSSAGNCERNEIGLGLETRTFGGSWSGDITIGFAVGMSVHGRFIYVFE